MVPTNFWKCTDKVVNQVIGRTPKIIVNVPYITRYEFLYKCNDIF